MRVEDLTLVSLDDHIVEPPEMFEGRIPAKFADRAPRVIQNGEGDDVWLFDGKQSAYLGLNAVVGRPPDEYGLEPTSYSEFRPGCFGIHERVKGMSANGVLGSLNFPSFPRFCGQLFSEAAKNDAELASATIEA